MPLIPFPDVPNVPGVPAIARSITVPTPEALEVGLAGALTDSLGFSPSVWGVFDDGGNKALDPDSFVAFEYKNSSRVSDYPQEQGAFASYNKVATPFDVRVRMSIGADLAARTGFLATCDAMLKSIDLFTVVTPEATYVNVTLDNYDYRREQKNGATMLTVELSFVEIRITATAQFSQSEAPADTGTTQTTTAAPLPADQVQSPSAASPESQGQVQAVPPTASQDASTNFVADSANDATNPGSGTFFSAPVAGAPVIENTPEENAALLSDRLNNPPPGLTPENLEVYKTGITARYGPKT